LIATERLSLRELRQEDAPFVLALANEPSFIQFIGDRGLRTIADAERYIDSGPWTQYAAHGFGLWLVSLRDSGEPIGICGLLTRAALPDPDIGFAFRQAFWSKGYAFEAASAVAAAARDTFKVPRLLAIVSPANAASIRLLEKLGFSYERMTRMSPTAAEVALYAIAFDPV
jgi:RimJ/RimL family protein N-acetyltransferase